MEPEYNRRSGDALLIKLVQKVDDHIDRFDRFERQITDKIDKHLSWAEAEKQALSHRVNVIESVWHSIEKPVKWVGWAVTIFFAVLITSMATHLTEWFRAHWGR